MVITRENQKKSVCESRSRGKSTLDSINSMYITEKNSEYFPGFHPPQGGHKCHGNIFNHTISNDLSQFLVFYYRNSGARH
jgi:hypothetical protein